MREETEFKPKPMVEIGNMPVMLHLMKLLAAQGLTEFIVCVGYRGDYIRDYFLNFRSRFSDFTVGTRHDDSVVFHPTGEIPDWKVTVAETGPLTPTGGRIKKIERYLDGERFFATYGDGLANVSVQSLIQSHVSSKKIATLTTTQPRSRYGVLTRDESGKVTSFLEKPEGKELVNMGYFVFEQSIFEYLDEDSVLETDPLESLVRQGQLNSYLHEGFFQPMDTQREVDDLRSLWAEGKAPWKIW
jgi:glucose-1-phosphate cytidylyltransferase